MLDVLNSQFDSFLFWRTPIPVVDISEIEVLGLDVPESGAGGQSTPRSSRDMEEQDGTLAQYNTFNFWREPIASFSGLDLEQL
ncbi:protein AF1q [Chiloscyllium plagiosum]|uniref:protein AF1q n=1 Tax=Chiloscyllium plagiosum TaxID=36176 RepID=UPI001CB7E44B|nr:protein AF1q [Chiloscyllium plagiosum]